MSLNPSSKLCFSKRLVIVSLLLFFVGLSIIVFSTLSSSINKTTSSKAEAPASIALKDFGGKNQPCVFNMTDSPEYLCNSDTSLVCDGPLDFWLSGDTKKAQMRKEDKGPRCIEPADILMGKEGQPCRKAVSGTKQCDSGFVCVDVVGDKWPDLSTTYLNYFNTKYKGKEIYYHFWALEKYFNIEKNPTDGGLIGTYGACIPESFTKVESCGDAGQKACKNELGQDFCFGENRKIYDINTDTYNCGPKVTITGKTLVRCDDLSASCNEFCSKLNAKCVETCEATNIINNGELSGSITIKGGIIGYAPYNGSKEDWTSKSGSCKQETFPGVDDAKLTRYGCNKKSFDTKCCCDKIK